MKKFNKSKNRIVKYSKAELESYVRDADSCVKKIESEEIIRYSPTATVNLQKYILDELGRKIGRYESNLEGVVLDFRDTKVHATQSEIRQDSPYSSIKVQTNFYVFKPQKDAVVTGVIKFINRLAMETVLSVVIYRVFNVRVTVRGKVKEEVESDQEIEIRLKEFHFDNVIPHVEGEIVRLKMLTEGASDSGVSVTSEDLSTIVKHERFTSDDDDNESNTSMQTKLNTKNNSKRKLEYDEETPSTSAKKVKVEPQTAAESKEITPVEIKKEKLSDDEEKTALDPDLAELLGLSKKSKTKKKSRKSLNFDAELSKLLDSV